jgi:hypothetical protein
MLYPVEATKKRQVRALLEESIFTAIESWLLEERSQSWMNISQRLECIYDQNGGTIILKSTNG